MSSFVKRRDRTCDQYTHCWTRQ